MQPRVSMALGLIVLAAACGGSVEPADGPEGASEPEPAAALAEKRPKDTLWRDEVDRTVDGGLGRFLQRVEVEAALDNGQFKGFRILGLYPPGFWQDVDLKPGDVVTRVNNMPIERETQAYDAFVALKKTSRLEVSYERGAERRKLVYKIEPRPAR